MGFCTKCGRQRAETGQFCTGCGAPFSDGGDAALVAERPQAEPERAAGTVDQPAQPDAAPDPAASQAGAPDMAASQPDDAPVAEPTRWDTNWYKPDPAPAGQPPYQPPPYQPPPHVAGTRGTSPLRRGQTAILIALLVVVLLAVGGGAYALVSRYAGHKTAAPPPHPATRSAPATPATVATTPAPSATGTASSTGPAASSPAAGPKVSPSPHVSVAAGVASNPAEPAVAAFLDRYFTAINTHDYAAYSRLLDAQEQSVDTRSSFDTGYGTTADSAETLTGIAGAGGGDEAATVSFTSHQDPADSPSKTACTSWTITLYLQPNGGGYLIGPAPTGYHASYQAC
jgi:hypothetical protein